MEDNKMADVEKDNRRFFFGPDEETKYYIETPTAEDIRGADWQYSKTFTQCLVEGITTSAEMVDILTRRGIIGREFEQRANELAQNLSDKIALLEDTEDLDVKRELSLEVARAREELFQWNQRLNGPMNNTAEQISDDARLEYLTSVMTVNEDGSKVWDSYDTYLKEKSQALALRARFEIMLFLQGLDSDFLDQTPEAQAMREVQQDVMEKAEEAIKAAEAVEEEKKLDKVEEENPKEAEEPKATKKTTKRGKPKKKK
jgi:hypothetical protein